MLASPLLRQITCPHCWKTFHPEEVLWIATHADLMGDARLGAEHQQRHPAHAAFNHRRQRHRPARLRVPRPGLPSLPPGHSPRLAGDGAALSVHPGHALACHGKSYFLAAMTWEAAACPPRRSTSALSFSDVDPTVNQALTANEEALFLHPRDSGGYQVSWAT